MDKVLNIAIDHVSILNFTLKTSTDIFFSLGFVREGGCSRLDEHVEEQMAPTSRFVFENAYIECVQFPPYIEEFYSYLDSPAGIHIAAFLTDNAEDLLQKLRAQGMEIEDLDRVTRKNFDYGDKKGTAVMLLVPIPREIIRRTHVAFLEHLTRDLIYQESRYRHPNGADSFLGTVICCQDEAEADRIEKELNELAELSGNLNCVGGARKVRLMDAQSIEREYGVHNNPEASAFSVLSFGASSFQSLRPYLQNTGYDYEETEDRIIVHLPEDLGLAFEFRKV